MKLIITVLFTIALLGCETVPKDPQQLQIDSKLIGIWEGEYLEKDGAIKKWTQTRKENGTYLIEFQFVEPDGTSNHFSENGQWWIQDGLFYEVAPSWMKRPDSYQYRFKENQCLEFLLVDSDESIEDIGKYTFVECLSDTVSLTKFIH